MGWLGQQSFDVNSRWEFISVIKGYGGVGVVVQTNNMFNMLWCCHCVVLLEIVREYTSAYIAVEAVGCMYKSGSCEFRILQDQIDRSFLL